jgi:hypothetical protein
MINYLSEHQIKQVALLLVKEWKELSYITASHPMQEPDYTTLVQIFHRMELSKVSNILLKTDDEYLKDHHFNMSTFDCANYYLINGEMPKKISFELNT